MATPRIQSVDRAFSLLACIARQGGRESLPTMAAQCGLSVATAHRLLTTMESLGAVIHTAPGEYRIGMGVLELSRCASHESLLAAAAEPTLRRITQTLTPTAHLGVLDAEFMVTYVAKANKRGHPVPTQIGSKLEAYCSGLGKVLLAALPHETRATYLDEAPFIALTSRTITDIAVLERELCQVSRQGYAVDDCEMMDDLRCVAVPIHDRAGTVVAALSASSPARDLPRSGVPAVARELHRFAQEIGAKLYPAPVAFVPQVPKAAAKAVSAAVHN